MDEKITRRDAVLGAAAAAAALTVASEASARQVHMEDALASLRTAHKQLNAASANKGGHRVKAMKLIEQAMAEVKAGIKFAGS